MLAFVRASLVISVFVLSSCAPRGETKTLTEVLENSKKNYQSASTAKVAAHLSEPLKNVSQHLDQITAQQGAEAGKSAGELAELLNGLVDHAGYTVRPGMNELISQYRMLSKNGADVQTAQVKLLASRTYSLLTSELNTTSFGM